MQARKITIKDVAENAEVSLGTVSNVLNGLKSVNPRIRKRVLDTADKLGYSPNIYAKGIRADRYNSVGILISSTFGVKNLWLQDYLLSIISWLSKRDCMGLVELIDCESEKLPKCLNCSDAIIVVGVLPERILAQIGRLNIPVGSYLEHLSIPNSICIENDFVKIFKAVIGHLLAFRHENIGYITKHLFSESQQQKLKAFCNAFSLYKRSVPDESFIIKLYEDDDNHFNDGYNSTMQLLRQHPETTAIVYSSDCIAKGGLAAVKELGLKIPDDISIVSFDNSDWACSYTPAISSCAENSKNISDILLSNLFKKIESRNMKAEVVTEQVQMEFIPRESTGLAKR